MTTNDPFANPPTTPSAQPVPPTPPAPPPGMLTPPMAPGMLTPPAPPGASPYPFAAPSFRPAAPTGLAMGAIIFTGLYALVGLVGALTAAGAVESLKETLADPDSASFDVTTTLIGFVTFLVGVGSYVFLALWMTKIRSNRTAMGTAPGGPPAVEWWGWFIPLAWFVLPFLGMRAITRRLVGTGLLLGWWIPFAIYWILYWTSVGTQFTAIDYMTGELTSPEALDSMVPIAWASAVAILISWLFLAVIIRKTTAKHLND